MEEVYCFKNLKKQEIPRQYNHIKTLDISEIKFVFIDKGGYLQSYIEFSFDLIFLFSLIISNLVLFLFLLSFSIYNNMKNKFFPK